MKRLIIDKINVEDLKSIISEIVTNSLKEHQQQDDFLNVTQASDYLKIPVTTLYDYTSNKKIPFHKKGKTLHFSRQELSDWMKNKQGKEVGNELLK